jgi:hypothetical protein
VGRVFFFPPRKWIYGFPALIFSGSIDNARQYALDHHLNRVAAGLPGIRRPMVLEQTFSYPELALQLDQYAVIEESGSLLFVYRLWRQEYTPVSIASELKVGTFEVLSLWGDLTGIPLEEGTEWIGSVARKD